MRYQRSLEIEQRLQTVLSLVETGEYSTPLLAKKLSVLIPTVSRDVTSLRERGHNVRSCRQSDGSWRFTIVPRQLRVKDRRGQDGRGRRSDEQVEQPAGSERWSI